MRSVGEVTAEAGKGLVGDRYHGSRHLHVTVQSQEALDAAAADLGHDFPCSATRRNVTVDAGRVPDRPGEKFRIGEVDVEVVRVAAPCRLLDDGIGPGAAAALRGRAGSVCRILSSGPIRIGDPVDTNEQ
jgi:MOSC domain-containing protein YiiM